MLNPEHLKKIRDIRREVEQLASDVFEADHSRDSFDSIDARLELSDIADALSSLLPDEG